MTLDHPDIICTAKHHKAPTVIVGLVLAGIGFALIGSVDQVRSQSLIVGLLVGAVIVGTYIYRTFKLIYLVTNQDVAVVRYNGEEGFDISSASPLSDIGYIYVKHTGFRYFLWKFGMADYGDICFCENINTPAHLIFHNVAGAEEVHLKIIKAIDQLNDKRST